MKKTKTKTKPSLTPEQRIAAVRQYAANNGVSALAATKALKIPAHQYYDAVTRLKRRKQKERAEARKTKKKHPRAQEFEALMATPAPTRQGKKVTAMIFSGDAADVAAAISKMMEGNQ